MTQVARGVDCDGTLTVDVVMRGEVKVSSVVMRYYL